MPWTHLELSLPRTGIRLALKTVASLYQQWGWEAICLAMRYSTRYFTLLDRVATLYGLKPLYAVEILTHAPGVSRAYPALVVASHQKGVQQLYRLVGYVTTHHKKVVSPGVLEHYQEGLFLLVGEELEQDEASCELSVRYYQKVWQQRWWVLCSYTETKPIERLRQLVERVKRYHLRALASVPQQYGQYLWNEEDVARVFSHHPDFITEVGRFLDQVPALSILGGGKKREQEVLERGSEESWQSRVVGDMLGRLFRYGRPFLVHTLPCDRREEFRRLKRRGRFHQSVMFRVQWRKVVLVMPGRVLHHALRWLGRAYRGHVGCMYAQGGVYHVVVSRLPIEGNFAVVGECEGIPLIQTTEEVIFQEGILLCRLETHWVWDLLCDLNHQGVDLRYRFPMVIRWSDHPLVTDMGFFSHRYHVIHGEGAWYREISRVMHPAFQGPFLYREEALVYLSRFIPAERARRFLTLLQKDDPRWIQEKQEIESLMPAEALSSLYWRMLLQEGKFLLSRRQERLRWYGYGLLLALLHQDPLRSLVAGLNRFPHPRQKNRLILYGRLALGIEFLPPSVSQSQMQDTLEQNRIRLGLCHLSGIPLAVREAMVRHQPYRDFFDFLGKHPAVRKKTILEWVTMGLCDDLEPENEEKVRILESGGGQDGLFDERALWMENRMPPLPSVEKKPLVEVCGLYAREHPLDRYAEKLALFRRNFLRDCGHLRFGVYVAALVGVHRHRGMWIYEIVDETAWKRVFCEKSPPFTPRLYHPYIWRLVLHRGELEVVEMFEFGEG